MQGEIYSVGDDAALEIKDHADGLSIFHRFAAPNSICVLGFGVLLVVGWTGLRGYGLFEFAELVF